MGKNDELTVAQLALDAANETYKEARAQSRDVDDKEVKEIEKFMEMREKALARSNRK